MSKEDDNSESNNDLSPEEEDSQFAGNPELPWPRVPPGKYIAICQNTSYGKSFSDGKDLYLNFNLHMRCLSDPNRPDKSSWKEVDGTKLFMKCPKPVKLTYRTKLHQAWTAILGRNPEPKERFNKDVFQYNLCVVIVRDTIRRFSNKELMPPYMQYSVVDSIVEVYDGDL